DFLNVLHHRLIFELAGPQGFGRMFALDAEGDAVGDGSHFLKGGLGERVACKEGHEPDDALLEHERIAGESDDALAPGPGLISDAWITNGFVDQNWFPIGNRFQTEADLRLLGSVFFSVAHGAFAG